MRTGGQRVVDVLEREGVSCVFTVPGESFLPLLDALVDSPIRTIAMRHEGGAAFMAEGYAKATGRPGVCMATRGPGASNLCVGLHTARQDSTPVVAIIGQVPRGHRHREAWQEVDLPRFFAPLVKWAVEIPSVDRIPELLGRAFAVARQGRPGPVAVSIPEDVLWERAEGEPVPPPVPRPALHPREADVERALELLANARAPFIVAGGGCRTTDGRFLDSLIALAEALEAPVAVAFRRHDVFPNDHRLFVGHMGIGPHRALVQAFEEADVVLAVGTRLGEVTTQRYRLPRPGTRLIHIARSETIIEASPFATELGIVADAPCALEAMVRLLDGGQVRLSEDARRRRRERNNGLRQAYEEATRMRSPEEFPSRPVHPEAAYAVLARLMPEDAIIANDAGNFSGWLHRFWRFTRPLSYIGPTSGAMGYGLPGGMGAKLAHPDRPVINFAGDGGFLMTAAELETAVRENLPVINVVFNNRMYGTIRMHQEREFPGRVIATDLPGPRFAEMAAAFGAHGERVEAIEELPGAFQRALASGRPAVVEIMTDPNVVSVGATIDSLRAARRSG